MSASFETLGLIPELWQQVADLGYIEPTPIQAQAIPVLLEGRDVMGQAQTGTGKTAAFTLPLLQKLDADELQALILTPTRELAIQVAEAVYRYGSSLGVRVLPVYGGQPYSRQKRRLEKGVHVVVGTPGRTLDLINQKALKLHNVRYLVLDEADEMLKMGFIDDVEAIVSAASHPERQSAFFSATLPKEVQRLAQKYLNKPEHIAIKSDTMTVDNITQRYYVVNHKDKVAALSRLLEVEDMDNTLIFTRTKAGAAQLTETLQARGYAAEAIHGDLPQIERERVLRRFRSQQVTILVATDVVARGVDIPDVSHVINFDITQLPIEYVHRIGRTGRAGRTGDSITLINPRERKRLRMIEDYTRQKMTKAKLPSREDILAHREVEFKEYFVKKMDALTEKNASDAVEVLEALITDGYDLEQVALASIQLLRAHEQQRPLEDIRDVNESRDRGSDNRRSKSRKSRSNKHSHEDGMVRLYMDIGRSDGINPGEVVASIAGTSNIPGKSIGAIRIQNHETFVDVEEVHVDQVLSAMTNGRIRNKHVTLVRAEGLFDDSRGGSSNGNGNGYRGKRNKRKRGKHRPRRRQKSN